MKRLHTLVAVTVNGSHHVVVGGAGFSGGVRIRGFGDKGGVQFAVGSLRGGASIEVIAS